MNLRGNLLAGSQLYTAIMTLQRLEKKQQSSCPAEVTLSNQWDGEGKTVTGYYTMVQWVEMFIGNGVECKM